MSFVDTLKESMLKDHLAKEFKAFELMNQVAEGVQMTIDRSNLRLFY